MSDLKYYAIIVGGGSGSRMRSDIPKQFMLLAGKPVLMHTMEAFHSSGLHPELILVLPADFHTYWADLCREHRFDLPHQVVAGGEQRFHSVNNGLSLVVNEGVVAVHDAVRPCVTRDLIAGAFRQATEQGSAVAAIKSRDSVRQKTAAGSINLKREDIFLVQTPQVFRSGILKRAYEQPFSESFTDDASVVEQSGAGVEMIEGDVRNIKITYPDDIFIAEMYLKREM